MTTYELPPEPPVGTRLVDRDGTAWVRRSARLWNSEDPDMASRDWGAVLRFGPLTESQEPRPLAVGDRVRVVKPEYASGSRVGALAAGDVGEVTELADDDGDIGFRRDGTSMNEYIAPANVERIEKEMNR